MSRRWIGLPCRLEVLVVGALLTALTSSPVVAQEQATDPVATRKYSVALGFQKKKLYDQAATRWQQFIQAYPKHLRLATAHHHLGVCQIQQKKFPEAAASFRTVLTKFPKFQALDSAQFNLGLALYNSALVSKKPEEFKQAVATFAAVPAKKGDSKLIPMALFYQAECMCLAGNLQGAVPVYQKLVGGFPNDPLLPRVQHALGATFQDLDKEAEATATFQAFLTKFAENPLANDCRLRLGVSLFNQNKFAEAEPLFAQTAAAAEFPSADFALMKYAQTLFEQEKLPEAAAQYESLPQKFKESSYIELALLAAGKCRFRTEEFPSAQNHFTAVVNLKQDDAPEAAYWLGRTLVKLMKPAEAITALDQAIAAYPKSEFLPLCKYGRIDAIFAIADRQKEAVPQFAQFAAENPKHEKAPESLYRATRGALQLEDFAAAQKYSQTFLANAEFVKHELAPQVLLTGAESYLRAEVPDPTKSEAFFRRLVAEFPQHEDVPRAHLGVGVSLHAAQKYDAAIDHLTKSTPAFKDPALLAESRLWIGRSHLDAGRAKDAVPVLQSAQQAKPDWKHVDEVLIVLAVSRRGAEQLKEAVVVLNQLNSAHPKSTYRDQAIYQLGEIHFQQQEYDAAIADYQNLIKQLPESAFVPAALYGTAAAQFEKLDYKAAVASLDQLITQHAAVEIAPRGKYLRGMCRLRLMQYEPGVKDLTEFIATKPVESDALGARFALARCQVALKQHAAAINGLNALLKDKPDYERADDVYYELAFAYLDTEKAKEAAATFRQLAEKLPMSQRAAESWYRVGEFHESAEQLPLAATALAAGLKIPVESTEPAIREKLYYKLGSVQHKQEQTAASVQTLQAQLKEFAKGELAHAARHLLGESLFREKKFPEALAAFTVVAASQEEPAKEFRARSLYRSGMCAANLKQWGPSQQHYAALIAQFPKFEVIGEARYGLGISLQNQNKLDEAKAIFKQVTETEPDTETAAKSWFMMGQCWFSQKKYAEAIDCFSEVAFGFKHEQWQPLSYFEAGRCYIQLKDPDAARKMLVTVIQDFPKHPRVNDAKTILAELEKKK
ncbi:MAG TPA: tetratricopeptide repeat protein [Pirellulaceae bacterium]|nr:tetratricopeptide repeat protein [Pirellulaceae bacterium]